MVAKNVTSLQKTLPSHLHMWASAYLHRKTMNTTQALQKYFGYSEFRHEQEAIINTVLSGRDVLALMPTGGGKSLCYQLPAVLLQGLTIVISPLIALMKDQVDALNLAGIPAAFLNSSQSPGEQNHIIAQLNKNHIKLLYLAPERLFGSGSKLVDFLRSLPVPVSQIAIDEAHCISHWGHDFRPEYLMLAGLKDHFPNIPVIALTATADKQTRKDILDKLDLKDPAVFISSFNRANITYRVNPKRDSFDQLLVFLNDRRDESGIIYCLSRKSTESLAQNLRARGYAADAYHAGLDNAAKAKNQEAFLRDEVKIMVATIAFGMGINKSNVRYVVHMDLPKNIEGYYQETGRAGRDGLASSALLFYSPADVIKLKSFVSVDGDTEQTQIMLQKLDDMAKYAQLPTCRRKYLLNYFDEAAPDHCGSCDICLSEVTRFDGTLIAQKALSAVWRLKERFGAGYVIDFLRGSKNEKIRQEHKELKTYGVGQDIGKADWQRYLRELVALGYLQFSSGEYPVLQLTGKSEAVLKGLDKVELIATQTIESRATEDLPFENDLLEKLKTVRRDIAMLENVPAYVVLSDAALVEMATYLPQNLNELGLISGFGEVKLARYGREFLLPITTYTAEHHLSSRIALKGRKRERKPRAEKPTAPRSADTRRDSLTLYQKDKSIAEIAKERGLTVSTIESHLSHFVTTGEIDVRDMVPAAKIAVIQEAIESYGAERLSPLKEVLGDNYSYGEIKAVLAWMNRNE